ncbi:hypothetical protein B0T19DRAFT_295403 [Cercophora scortea]|uniref:Uncharacterized protein n=1 Tax=Cercophora scortea TaxID=314031 RepID=A0AAE0I305_9PEZI|nr:hypothetical protein B0T19DRAFT_295403 [Cercophora scortea]
MMNPEAGPSSGPPSSRLQMHDGNSFSQDSRQFSTTTSHQPEYFWPGPPPFQTTSSQRYLLPPTDALGDQEKLSQEPGEDAALTEMSQDLDVTSDEPNPWTPFSPDSAFSIPMDGFPGFAPQDREASIAERRDLGTHTSDESGGALFHHGLYGEDTQDPAVVSHVPPQMTGQSAHHGSDDMPWPSLLEARVQNTPSRQNHSAAFQHEPISNTTHLPHATTAGPFQASCCATTIPHSHQSTGKSPRSEAWTPAQDDFVRELKDRGTTHPVISDMVWERFQIYRTPNVISKRLKKLRDGCVDEVKLGQVIRNSVPKVQKILAAEITSFGLVDIDDPEGSLLAEASEEVKEFLPRVLKDYLREVACKMMSETRAS